MPDFPDTWQRRTLGELGRYINGMAFKPSDWSDTGLPIIRIQNLTDVTKPFNKYSGPVQERYLVRDGDLLISWSASLGSFIWNRGDAVLNQHIFKVEPNIKIVDKEFLHFLALRMLEEMRDQTHGSTMKHITKGKFDGLEVGVPGIEEQRRLVGRIRECYDRIAEIRGLRAQTIADTDRLEAAAFHDFILSAAEQQRWPTVPLGEITFSSRYGTSAKAQSDGTGVPVLRMGNIVDGVLDYSDLKYISLTRAELHKYLLLPGDILINRTNSLELVGKAATFERDDGKWVYASYLVCIRVDLARAIPQYVAAVINSNIGREYILRTARRAIGMVNINAKEMGRFPIPLPSLEEQQSLVDKLAEVRAAARQIRSGMSLPDIDHLAAAVLRKAFAGEL